MPLPSYYELYFDTPLYEDIDLNGCSSDDIMNLYYGRHQVDGYCRSCDRDTVFTNYVNHTPSSIDPFATRATSNDLICARDAKHKYSFYFRQTGKVLKKVGQWPSVADLAQVELKKYRRVLGSTSASDLSRAVGLSSHGVGAGSFVYLRRVFEKLIQDHWDAASKVREMPEIRTKRMNERIEELKDQLPPILVKNSATYSILSIGVHELDEQTCLKYFPVVKSAIIQILEQDLRAQEEKRAEAELQKQIAAIATELATKS